MLAFEFRALAALVVLCVVCPGCSDDKMVRLSGTVTLDGAPLEKGTISLAPADGNAPTAEALVTAGKYEVKTMPGAKNVVIHGLKKVGTRRYHPDDPGSPMVDVNEETVPARYNTASELTAAVKAGESKLDFALTTQAP
jgi:hypothetical protein